MVLAFSSLARIWGDCSTIHSSTIHFPSALFFFFFNGDWLVHTNFTLWAGISPQWLSELSRQWLSVPWRVACEFVSLKIPTLYLDSGIISPPRILWVKVVCVFRCIMPPALLAEWPRSFTCHCGNTGVEQTSNKSQHTKLTLEKKNSPAKWRTVVIYMRASVTQQCATWHINSLARAKHSVGPGFEPCWALLSVVLRLLWSS